MESGKGDYQVELPGKMEIAGISISEGEVGPARKWKPALGEADHLRRAVYSQNRSLGQERGDMGGDLSIAAADIQNSLVSLDFDLGDDLLGPYLLSR